MNWENEEVRQLRQVMEAFIAERLQAKLDKTKEEQKRRQLIEKHQPAAWIADAAWRVKQIQLVTHALKYTHPDARGTSLYCPGNPAAGETVIGTHSLQGTLEPDMVGSAGMLPVFKFLSLTVKGKTIWQRAVENDPALFAALPGTDDDKRAWIAAFATLVEPKGPPASHKLARQVYWPLADGGYHLLQPLFATSLVQQVWQTLWGDRFSEANRDASQARREGRPHPHGYREWPGLVIQKFGSTKPQNISQLNTVRHGEVWLLPARPPVWRRREMPLPLKVDSVFERFGRLRRVRERLDELGRYLVRVRDWNNKAIRNGRARRVEAIIDELIQYAAMIQQQPPGWSAADDCHLPDAQCFWLDPHRNDDGFQQRREACDWPRAVAEAFGTWLNQQLRHHRLPVGDAEFRQWRREFEQSLQYTLEEMAA